MANLKTVTPKENPQKSKQKNKREIKTLESDLIWILYTKHNNYKLFIILNLIDSWDLFRHLQHFWMIQET